MAETTPVITHYARFLLEEILHRKHYTGPTLEDMEEAIQQIITYDKLAEKPRTTPLASYIRAAKQAPTPMVHRTSRSKDMPR